MKKLYFLFSLLIFFSYLCSYSQNPEWFVYNRTNSDLTSNTILAIAIDSSENKWVGTNGELLKFNGFKWTIFDETYSSLIDKRITSIGTEKSGTVWVCTRDGLIKFDGTTWTNYTIFNSGLLYISVYSIAIDDSGYKWLGSYFFNIIKFDGTNWIKYQNDSIPSNTSIISITIDSMGNKWIGTGGGDSDEGGMGMLAKFDGNNWTTYYNLIDCLPAFDVFSIAIDRNQTKWLGGMYGFVRYDDSTCKSFTTSNSNLPHNKIRSVVIDNEGNKWLGTDGGLAKFDDSTWTVWNTENSDLPSNIITCIVIDKYNNKWIGTEGGGLAVFREGGVVGVEVVPKKNESKIKCEVCSNVGENIIKIKYNDDLSNKVNLHIYDILGRLVYSENKETWQLDGINTLSINMNNMQNGVYNVIINSGKSYNYCNFVFIK